MFDLKNFRRAKQLTQSEVAEMFKCGQPNISAIEKGTRDLEPYQREILIARYGNEEVSKYELVEHAGYRRKVTKDQMTALINARANAERFSGVEVRTKLAHDTVLERAALLLKSIQEEREAQEKESLEKALIEISELRKQVSELIKTNKELTERILKLTLEK